MNLKTFLASSLALVPLYANGQAVLSFADNKSFKQVGPREFEYQGGSLTGSLIDGAFALAPCASNGSPVRVGPNITCPLGTTAFITAGDIDGDLERDVNLFYSVSQVLGGLQVEPFQSNRIRMIAAPPSKLERPIGGSTWFDNSVVLWFDQINFPVRAYELTGYQTSRDYAANELQRQYDEIVPGTYIYEFPRINDDLNPFPIRITHVNMIEAWPGRGVVPSINEFTLLNDDLWSNGQIEIDPRVFNDFNWRGFNGNTVFSEDVTNFSIINRSPIFRDSFDLLTGEVLEDVEIPVGTVVFPPYDVSETFRPAEQIATPSTGYELGPFFFNPGEEVTAVIDFSRRLISTGNSRDTSTREFSWDIRFVETFEGEIVNLINNQTIPSATPDEFLAPDGDYDGDGVSNVEEFGLQTSLTDPSELPVLLPFLDPNTQQCILNIPKRPGVGTRLEYSVQYTTDLVNWTTITYTDPDWFIETDNENTYRVRSRQPAPPATCLLRVQVAQK